MAAKVAKGGLDFMGQNLDYIPTLKIYNNFEMKKNDFPAVGITIGLERKFDRYLRQTIGPSLILVIMSWVR